MKLFELTKDTHFTIPQAPNEGELIFVKTDGMYCLCTDIDNVVLPYFISANLEISIIETGE